MGGGLGGACGEEPEQGLERGPAAEREHAGSPALEGLGTSPGVVPECIVRAAVKAITAQIPPGCRDWSIYPAFLREAKELAE